jgi:dTDP-4-amino-4,6-dideoxygalactose transaminase
LDVEETHNFVVAGDVVVHNCNDFSAAVGLANLNLASDTLRRHRENARYLIGALAGANPLVTVPVPDEETAEGSAWWLFTVLVDDRAEFIEHMRRRGIDASPVHRRNDVHPGFIRSQAAWTLGEMLPGVDAFSAREVAIPCGWWLTEHDRRRIIAAVLEYEV